MWSFQDFFAVEQNCKPDYKITPPQSKDPITYYIGLHTCAQLICYVFYSNCNISRRHIFAHVSDVKMQQLDPCIFNK